MKYRIIKTPAPSVRKLIKNRLGFYGDDAPKIIDECDAIALVQGLMVDMVCAADIAEKAVDVEVYDVHGVCPQHMTLLAIFGDTAAVYDALASIRDKLTNVGDYKVYD